MQRIFSRASRAAQIGSVVMIALLAGCKESDTKASTAPKKLVDLSPVITEDLALRQYGHRACEFLGLPERTPFTDVLPAKPEHNFGMRRFTVTSHVGAHIDAPGRLLRSGERADQVPLEKLYGRAQIVDLRWKDKNSPLQISDLENFNIQPDTIVILYVGYSAPQDDDWPTYSALSLRAAQWLVERKIRALATDMPSIGSLDRYADRMDKNRPTEEIWEELLAFSAAGIPVIEGLSNLSSLLGEKNITFAGFPLAIADRSGAPMRAVAFVY